jgi:sec-independent protein translocase protein TatB
MFDIGATELLVIVIAAIVVIGPKDLPLALRTAGKWIGKMRRMSNHVRTGFDAMIREAEMQEMEREWRERNAQIMQSHPQDTDPARLAEPPEAAGGQPPLGVSAEARVHPAAGDGDDAWAVRPASGPAEPLSDRPAS